MFFLNNYKFNGFSKKGDTSRTKRDIQSFGLQFDLEEGRWIVKLEVDHELGFSREGRRFGLQLEFEVGGRIVELELELELPVQIRARGNVEPKAHSP